MVAHILNKRAASPVITLSNLVRENQLRVCINASPQPKVPARFLALHHPARLTTDILPLFVHFDSPAWQIVEVWFHVIGKGLASLADNSRDGVGSDLEHFRNRFNGRALAQRRQN